MNLINRIKVVVNSLGLLYAGFICRREYDRQTYTNINERPVELAFLFRYLAMLWPQRVLDVGTGTTALPHLIRNCGMMVTATDNIRDYWPQGMINRHYHVIDDDICKTKLSGDFDMITCVSVLEHIREFDSAVSSMFSLLRHGGHLVLTFPYHEKNYVENVYSLPESGVREKYSFVTQCFSRNEIDRWLAHNHATIVAQEYWQFYSGDYWTCGEAVTPPRQVDKHESHQITCLILRKL